MARSDVLVSTDWAQSILDAPDTVFVEVDEDKVVELMKATQLAE